MTNRMLPEVLPPGEFLQEELDARGWLQADFAEILGKDAKTVSDLISGKRTITPEMAILIGEALGTGASVWLNLENEYQLFKASTNKQAEGSVSRKAQVYGKYPVREMLKRGWISQIENIDALETELSEFFTPVDLKFAARRKEDPNKEMLQLAWLYRARNLALRMPAKKYSELGLARALEELRSVVRSVPEIASIPKIFERAGIRFVIVERLPASGIDGVCFWLDDNSPVIAMSVRYDRIDNFWFTLIHECMHVKHNHGKAAAMVDIDIEERGEDISDEEKIADSEASEYLVPQAELHNFVARVQPFFSTTRVEGFAQRMKVHPGVVVGQLHHHKIIEPKQHRKMLIKVRELITATAFHDGWGVAS